MPDNESITRTSFSSLTAPESLARRRRASSVGRLSLPLAYYVGHAVDQRCVVRVSSHQALANRAVLGHQVQDSVGKRLVLTVVDILRRRSRAAPLTPPGEQATHRLDQRRVDLVVVVAVRQCLTRAAARPALGLALVRIRGEILHCQHQLVVRVSRDQSSVTRCDQSALYAVVIYLVDAILPHYVRAFAQQPWLSRWHGFPLEQHERIQPRCDVRVDVVAVWGVLDGGLALQPALDQLHRRRHLRLHQYPRAVVAVGRGAQLPAQSIHPIPPPRGDRPLQVRERRIHFVRAVVISLVRRPALASSGAEVALEHGQSVEELDIAACRARQEVRRVVVVTRVTVGPHPVAVALVAGLHPLRQ
eukprot:scaffold57672_cov58-Phaeocystis_antarctica.AAC.1